MTKLDAEVDTGIVVLPPAVWAEDKRILFHVFVNEVFFPLPHSFEAVKGSAAAFLLEDARVDAEARVDAKEQAE